jgi:membrane protease YdiL (CAAX protease family)
MSDTAPPPRPFFQISGVTAGPVRTVLAVILAAAIMQFSLIPGRELARWLYTSVLGLGPSEQVGLFVFLAIMFQAATALIGVLILKRVLPKADAHLRWPPGRSYIGLAVVIGLAMGLIMLAADYWPELLAGTAPDGGYSTAPLPAFEWLLAMITTGLAEETLFRGVMVGMLVVLIPGRVRLGAFEISLAGVLVAVLFGLAHYDAFLHNPLHLAIAQQIYAFLWGVTYVWLMERSKSLVAPIVAHGIGNATEVALIMVLMIVWA